MLLEKTLCDIEFFKGIPEQHLERLAAIARSVEFPPQSIIFREQEHANVAYVIVSGEVALINCIPEVGCRVLMSLSNGDLFGWSPIVGRQLLSDTAQSLTTTTALAFDGEQLLAICREDPEFGVEFMHRIAKVIAERLSATRMQLLKTGADQLPEVQIESD